MRQTLSLAAMLASTVVLAGCIGRTSQPVRVPPSSDSTTNTATTASKTFAIGEEATIGGIVHKVVSVQQMDVIPASATLPEWEIIAEDTPAAAGFTWVHILGEVTNTTKEPKTLTSTGVYISDPDGNQFEVSTDTTIYVDSCN